MLTPESLWAKVARGPGCWEWQGTRNEHGYGVVYKGWLAAEKRPVNMLAHRATWEHTNGPIPAGLYVLHRCDNPPCVRPDHLFLGTQTDNMVDAGRKGSMSRDVRGERNPSRRLTAADVRQIRRLYQRTGSRRHGSVSQEELARRFVVHETTIGKVVNGKTWKEVTP